MIDLDALFDALGVSSGARAGLVSLTDDTVDTTLTVTGQTDFSITLLGVGDSGSLTVGGDATFDINVGTYDFG